jgi:hypothetical protein
LLAEQHSLRASSKRRLDSIIEKEDKMANSSNHSSNLQIAWTSRASCHQAGHRGEKKPPSVHAQAEATDNALAKRFFWTSPTRSAFIGGFSRLLSILTEGVEDKFLAEGATEVNEMAAAEGMPLAEPASGGGMTVGSLRE